MKRPHQIPRRERKSDLDPIGSRSSAQCLPQAFVEPTDRSRRGSFDLFSAIIRDIICNGFVACRPIVSRRTGAAPRSGLARIKAQGAGGGFRWQAGQRLELGNFAVSDRGCRSSRTGGGRCKYNMLSFIGGLLVGAWISGILSFALGATIRRSRDHGPDYYDY